MLCRWRRDKYRKNTAFLVLYGLCNIHMVLWYNVQLPPCFPTVGCEGFYSHIASYNEILKEPALISNSM